MNQEAIWEKLTETFREVFDEPDLVVRSETTAKDVLDWDSLTHIQLLVALEQTFEVRFNTGEVAGLADVGAMIELIASKVN